ncbi:MAG: NADH-dependent [FeFe] hydrogenase, group A6 [Ezakiella sp.]|nr:NADH-dependent [FeFe] hydrogenase, group A6 [Ezakiella sp.]MDD7471379.1 NADH-dependent [FeFe] hydrogenase, group A6 [Bacillota bacterium]MDY3922876.1 NADH-dependent [FeFe] hydrogenase, group A6 [Ezakiella sp.]
MVNLKINDVEISVEKGTTILNAAEEIGIKIPTLCHLDLHDIKFLNKLASCRVCMVEDAKSGKLFPACATPVKEGMNIKTDSSRAVRARRTMVELLLSDHPNSCLTCAKNLDCQLQKIAHDLGVREIPYHGEMRKLPIDSNSLSIVRNPNKCILCRRCETMCSEVQTVGALSEIGRGFYTHVGSTFNRSMYETTCTFCGQCVSVCPTGALTEVSNIGKVWRALNSDKTVVVQTAPAVRVALGECFDLKAGTIVTGKMVTALKKLGFDMVFDTNFAADLTIMEEAHEFVERLNGNGKLPILTSCCPGWVNFMEQQFSDMIDIPSTCKSPHEMFGAIAKSYLCEKMNIKPEDMYVVSIMPCVAKKFESARPELEANGNSDVDTVITTRELALMIKEAGINFLDLEDSAFDDPMGESTGAGAIFGATGGVIEATVRTAYKTITGEELDNLEFEALRGFDGIKEANINIDGRNIRIAVANGLGNTRRLLEGLRNGEEQFDAIEVMACPGGCIGGGGQPYHHGNISVLKRRAEGIYSVDKAKIHRRSHENPKIRQLYDEYLGEVAGPRAHELLHTTYEAKPKL